MLRGGRSSMASVDRLSGLASGVDTSGIVDQLMAIDRQQHDAIPTARRGSPASSRR